MAYVKNIWFFTPENEQAEMAVFVNLKPAGEVRVNVELPEDFYKSIMQIAQNAADLHESKMRAEILADKEKGANNDETI